MHKQAFFSAEERAALQREFFSEALRVSSNSNKDDLYRFWRKGKESARRTRRDQLLRILGEISSWKRVRRLWFLVGFHDGLQERADKAPPSIQFVVAGILPRIRRDIRILVAREGSRKTASEEVR